MNGEENINSKIWVIKYCLKLLYPKLNTYILLIYIAIKYRYYYKKGYFSNKKMNVFALKTLPRSVLLSFMSDHIKGDTLSILSHKCIIIPYDQFIQFSVENFFYKDNGILWVTMKITPEQKTKENTKKENTNFKYNLNLVASEIHKKLWSNDKSQIDSERVVPIIGSHLVENNMAYTNEDEFLNIASTYGLSNDRDIEVSFHPLSSFEFSPKIAAVAEVNLIVNEYDIENDFLKEVLSNHFEIPKVFSQNDIIVIDLTSQITLKYKYKYLDLIESTKKLYFKCTKLQGDQDDNGSSNVIPAYYIVKGVTQLTLGENAHALKTKHRFFEVDSTRVQTHSLPLCPDGLREKFFQIHETIQPFVNGDIGMIK